MLKVFGTSYFLFIRKSYIFRAWGTVGYPEAGVTGTKHEIYMTSFGGRVFNKLLLQDQGDAEMLPLPIPQPSGSATKTYSKNMESMDLDKDTTKSRNMCCLFKLLNNEILLKEYVYFTGGKYKVIIASYMSYSSKMIRMRLCGFRIINDIM